MKKNQKYSRIITPFSDISAGIGGIILDLKQNPSIELNQRSKILNKASRRTHRNISLNSSKANLLKAANSILSSSKKSETHSTHPLRTSKSSIFTRKQAYDLSAPENLKTVASHNTLAAPQKNSFTLTSETLDKKFENHKLRTLSRAYHDSSEEVLVSEKTLRTIIELNSGLPLTEDETENKKLRAIFWMVLLDIRSSDPTNYLEVLKKCPSSSSNKINDDSFRTFSTDPKFRNAVSEKVLKRILNAVICCGEAESCYPSRYVQGMNVLLAPFSYVLNEPAAYYAFKQFLRNKCPLYAKPNLPGLVDECLAIIDPQLFLHLYSHNIHGLIYAFPAVLSISANIPPLEELLRIWDYLLACGVHLNVLCVVSQVLSLRELLLVSDSPKTVLQDWPTLDAHFIIQSSRYLYTKIPNNVRKLLAEHTHNLSTAESIISHEPSLNLVSQSLILKNKTTKYNKYANVLPMNQKSSINGATDTIKLKNNSRILTANINLSKKKKVPTNLGIVSLNSNSTINSQITRNRKKTNKSIRKSAIINDLESFVNDLKNEYS
ncbi:hypothetical protein BB561_002248 [Smittium simulii]|uniref:Rab-GAP TBC domain-containing protein n=1 Tax=Smittium simulii TaxID=133385 RepID=A0A2T9YR95_9FUNG|nr:hypothetical protein BB561_002248 [Smittium simulii]